MAPEKGNVLLDRKNHEPLLSPEPSTAALLDWIQVLTGSQQRPSRLLSLRNGVGEKPQQQGTQNKDSKPDSKTGQNESPGPGPPVYGFLRLACLMPLFCLWGQVLG